MVTRQDIVSEARSWIGTKYKHLGRVKGSSVDCVGLIIGVGNSLGLSGFNTDDYSQLPDPVVMKKHLDNELVRIELKEAKPGDIFWIKWAENPQHVAIFSSDDGKGYRTMIHSYALVKKCVEHTLDDIWGKRIVAAYKYKGID